MRIQRKGTGLSKYAVYPMTAGHPAVSSGFSSIWQGRGYVLLWQKNTATMPAMAVSQRIKRIS